MKDRITLTPNRVKLIPVAGLANTYDIVRADNPTQEGTALNKANLLSDSLAVALGIDSKPEGGTVNDALNALAPKAEYVRIHKGAGEPSNDIGKDGDVYINTLSGYYYYKVGDWVKIKPKTPDNLKPLSECSWLEISLAAREGEAANLFKVGDSKEITVNGEKRNAYIMAFNTDYVSEPEKYGRNKAGITFAFHYPMVAHNVVGANVDYTKSTMYNTCNSLLNTLDFKNYIPKVSKDYKTTANKGAFADVELFTLSYAEHMMLTFTNIFEDKSNFMSWTRSRIDTTSPNNWDIGTSAFYQVRDSWRQASLPSTGVIYDVDRITTHDRADYKSQTELLVDTVVGFCL